MSIDGEKDIIGLMAIGRICANAMHHMADHLEPGITTKELDEIGAAFLKKHGARSAPILAYNYPGYTCISINDEAAHGIPGDRVVQAGDLVNIDVSAEKDGYWADNGRTFIVPPVDPERQRLVDTTARALELAMEAAKVGAHAYEIGRTIEKHARRYGFQVIEDLGGHGVGRSIHEKPSIPTHYNRRARERLTEGMVITIEPFLTTGARHINTMPDGWTLKTTDGSLSAQMEHTIIVTKDGPIIVTMPN